MKKTIFFLIFCITQQAFALNDNDASVMFEEASKAYQAGDFKKANELYHQLATEYSSFELEFNLGNSCYKLDSIAAAILHYERARKINPYDEDLKTNLQIANQKVVDKIEALPTLGVSDLWQNITNEAMLKWWTAFTLIFVFIGMACFSIFAWKKKMLHRRILFFCGLMFVFFGILSFGLGRASLNRVQQNSEAIIFTSNIDVKGSPTNEGTTVFVLHEGTKVQIREEREEWIEIRLANGSVGWLKRENVRTI